MPPWRTCSTGPTSTRERIGGIGLSVGGEMMIEAAAESTALRAIVSEGGSARSLSDDLANPAARSWTYRNGLITAATSLFTSNAPPADLKSLVRKIDPRTSVFFVYGEKGQPTEEPANRASTGSRRARRRSGRCRARGTWAASRPSRPRTSAASSASSTGLFWATEAPSDPTRRIACHGPGAGGSVPAAMPIYEYVCMACESHFEELVRNGEEPDCPDCGASNVRGSSPCSRLTAPPRSRASAPPRPEADVAAGAVAAVTEPPDRARQLASYERQVAGCTRCRARRRAARRSCSASGDPDADLMFVGEAPGFHEDQQGFPFVGQAGKLLDQLLGGIGLDARRRLHRERAQVPAAGQPRPAARRDRGLRAAPVPADRADPAAASSRRSATSRRSCSPASRSASRASTARSSRRRSAGAACCSTRSTTRPPRSTRRRC